LVTEGFQVVSLDRIPADLHADAVVSDNEGATLRALHALESRGHRRIGFFSFHKPDFSSVNERYHAYQLALAEVGIQDATNLTRWFARELDGQPQQFVQAVHDSLFTLLKQDEPITALFCVQDSIASAASEACDRIGIQIPDRLEIVTFNDWPPMMLRTPWNMHRIVQRGYDIGQAAGNLLLERIQDPEGEPKTIRVDADFFVADAGIMPI
jgi:LacI family transcriptional regulator